MSEDLPQTTGFREDYDSAEMNEFAAAMNALLNSVLPLNYEPGETRQLGTHIDGRQTEQTTNSPELDRQLDPKRQLFEAIRPEQSALDSFRARFMKEVAVRRKTDLAGYAKKDFDRAIEYLDWQLFADYDTQAPAHIGGNNHRGKPGFMFDTYRPGTTYMGQAAQVVKELLDTTLIDPSIVQEPELSTDKTVELEAATAALIEASPIYKTLRSFKKPPESISTDRRRTQEELRLLENQTEQQLRRTNGLGHDESLRMHPQLLRSLQKQMNWAEDEFLPLGKTNPDRHNPYVAALRFMDQIEPFENDASRISLKKYVMEDAVRDRQLSDIPVFDYALSVKRRLGELYEIIHTGSIAITVDEWVRLHPYDAYILDSKRGRYGNSLTDGFKGEYYSNDNHIQFEGLNWISMTRGFIRETSGLSRKAFPRFGLYTSLGDEKHFTNKLEMTNCEDDNSYVHNLGDMPKQPFGDVLEYILPNGAPRKPRMLQPADYSTWLDSGVSLQQYDNAQLRLQMNTDVRNNTFTVAGFKPFYTDWYEVAFMYDAENDPYARAAVRLPSGKLDTLVRDFRSANLSEIADGLQQLHGKTVTDLEALLRAKTQYTTTGTGSVVNTKDIASFAEAYRTPEGSVELQCTGAAQLLKLSLHTLFGPESARVIQGQALMPGSATIGPIGHAQVLFVDPQTQAIYYLDSTPVGPPQFGGYADVKTQEITNDPVIAHAPIAELDENEQFEEATVESLKHTLQDAQDEILNIREYELIPILTSWFGARTREEVFSKLLKFDSDDPARRVLEAAGKFGHGNARAEDIESLRTYLQNLRASAQSNHVRQRVAGMHTDESLDVLMEITDKMLHAIHKINR